MNFERLDLPSAVPQPDTCVTAIRLTKTKMESTVFGIS